MTVILLYRSVCLWIELSCVADMVLLPRLLHHDNRTGDFMQPKKPSAITVGCPLIFDCAIRVEQLDFESPAVVFQCPRRAVRREAACVGDNLAFRVFESEWQSGWPSCLWRKADFAKVTMVSSVRPRSARYGWLRSSLSNRNFNGVLGALSPLPVRALVFNWRLSCRSLGFTQVSRLHLLTSLQDQG